MAVEREGGHCASIAVRVSPRRVALGRSGGTDPLRHYSIKQSTTAKASKSRLDPRIKRSNSMCRE
jgi:hypothetical protein